MAWYMSAWSADLVGLLCFETKVAMIHMSCVHQLHLDSDVRQRGGKTKVKD